MEAKAFHRIGSHHTLALSAPVQPHNPNTPSLYHDRGFFESLFRSHDSYISSADAFFNFSSSWKWKFIQSAHFSSKWRGKFYNQQLEKRNNEKCLLIKWASSMVTASLYISKGKRINESILLESLLMKFSWKVLL